MRKMQILIQTRDGQKSLYEADRFGTVGSLKAQIGRNMAVPMGFSRLSYKGTILSNKCVLDNVGIRRMSTLNLFWQPVVLTPSQVDDKDGDQDQLEQKLKGVTATADKHHQMVKTGGGGLLNESDSFHDGDALAGEMHQPVHSPLTQDEDEDEPLEDLTVPSTDFLGFITLNKPRQKSADEHIEKELVPLAAPLPEPLKVPQTKPETRAPAKSSKPKVKGKKNRKKK
ncbi:uncharacterized protein LOC108148099 [Drosophila elegans]|uniref:uncharacterized protein LOC108148099 n=1 Tax=Drosophila elegans TaxID=30023 RepID=UPI0007E6E53B|nr:uncharacterized protein LOC108148099 [Drosophila elegans]